MSSSGMISSVSMAQDLVPWPNEPEPGQGALLLGGVDYGEASVGKKEAKAEKERDKAEELRKQREQSEGVDRL